MIRSELPEEADRGEPAVAGPPLNVLREKGLRAPRLHALSLLRVQRDAETTAEIRRLAADRSEDAVLRSALIAALAERGESVATETQAPPTVQMAQRKASEILQARRLVATIERGGSAVLPAATLIASPTSGLPIRAAEPDPPVRARIAAAVSLRSASSLNIVLLRCGTNELAIAGDPARLDPAKLLQAPARPAQIMVHHTVEHDHWTAPYEVLTMPEPGGIRIAVVDARGRARFAGSGRTAGSNIKFSLQAADAPGAVPIHITGVVASGTVSITESVSGVRPTARRSPQRFRPR